jgi:hypothetical protein
MSNKESIDGSSKANITKSDSETVWGICYELDTDGFKNLKEYLVCNLKLNVPKC